MRFCDWMEACLYDPQDGYYSHSGHPAGTRPGTDYATAPTLHPFLAEAVAREATACWQRTGRAQDFQIVEYGGGDGRLAADAQAWLQREDHVLADAPWLHIEKGGATPQAGTRIDEMPDDATGLVVAHEFVDALPFHLLERRKGGWAEVLVACDDDGRFVEALGVPRRRAIEAAPKRLLPEGHRVTSMVNARSWLGEVAAKLKAGSLLIVDYGDRGRDLWTPERRDGTVRGFREHTLVDDVLADPGRTDITASVDFTQLREWGLVAGLEEAAFMTQEAWLVEHGALETLAQHGRDNVEDASAYLRLKQLVLPQGFGSAFKVQRLDRVQG